MGPAEVMWSTEVGSERVDRGIGGISYLPAFAVSPELEYRLYTHVFIVYDAHLSFYRTRGLTG
jgi:hypothetical protein